MNHKHTLLRVVAFCDSNVFLQSVDNKFKKTKSDTRLDNP